MDLTAARQLVAGRGVRAGDSPVWIDRAGGAVSRLDVRVLDRATVPARWRNGLLVRLGVPATTMPGKVKVSIDYGTFRHAFGGDWAARLRLWQVPACALSTPDAVGCRATPLPTVNDDRAGVASAQLTATADTMVALAAGPSGGSGDFTATSVSPTSSWTGGGSSGNFAWSYPLRLPPAPGATAPAIGLSYSSASVDGRSEATNNQPSWLGEGFDYEPGYIERRYVSCSDDMKNGANNTVKSGDMCWRSDNATMSLNGGGGELIFQSGNRWRSRTEDGSKIEKLTGGSNGDNNGEYWKVTTSNGIQYFFGRHSLPGQTAMTSSALTMPVFGNHTGEPCHQSAFANSSCTQVWRWNLDYVVDTHGNTTSYWYEQEANQYARNNSDDDNVAYARGAVLQRIDYGTYDRTSAEHGTTERSVTPTAQIVFNVADRCVTSCGSGSDPVKANWPDTPFDQECKASATSCPGQYSPTFWTTKRLAKITTRVWDTTKNPAVWQDVESWSLTHAFPSPGDGTHAGLWLNSIVHAGHVGSTVTRAPVTFEPTSMANRVLTDHNTTNNWLRIANVVLETGARLHVDYSLPECTAGNTPSAAHNNSKRCYPVLTPDVAADPTGETLKAEWWHKYLVTHIAEEDVLLADGHQAQTKHTWYEYVGAPAWHYADDDGLSKPKFKTWSQFRGYATVKASAGDDPAQRTLQVTNFLRGMHGDKASPTGGTRSVIVEASLGNEIVYDEDQFSGMTREEVTYNGTESKPVSKKVNVPWMSDPTATRTVNGDTVTARFVNTAITYDATALGVDGARGWRVSRGQRSFDHGFGTENWSQDDGDIAVNGDEKCITSTYNRNVTKNIISTVGQTTAVALPCGQNPTTVDDVIADVRHTYDGASNVTTAPVRGDVTKTEQLKDWSLTSGTQWQTVSQTSYDATGRPDATTDIKGNTTSTAYTPAVGGPVLKVTTTGPAPFNWVSTVESNPYWGSTVKNVDPNGKITGEAEYDPLGRVSRVWDLGWPRSANPAKPSTEYLYGLAAARDTYTYVATKTLNAKGNYVTSYEIFDGLMRPRQTQSISLNGDGNRIVTDTIYDARGQTAASYAAHAEPGAPSASLWWEPEWSVPAVDNTEYDRASRPVASVSLSGDGVTNLVEKWRTSTIFEGDLTKLTPPMGAIATTTVTDIEGRTIALRQHTTAAGVGGPYDETVFLFNRKGQSSKVIDPAGNEWVHTYDAKGRQIADKDPDKGINLTQYNDANELIKNTDARGKSLYLVYDQIGRKKELRDDSATGALRAEWKYDTTYFGQSGFRGQLTQAIRYEPAGSANAYKWQVRQFTGRYQPSGINVVIPTVETGLNGTYVYSYGFSSYTGDPTSTTYPTVGDLVGETMTTDYDVATGLPVRLDTNRINQAGTMLSTWYTAYGERSLTIKKLPGGTYVDDSIEYDPYSREVTRTTVKPETASGTISDRHYAYDNAGNITSIVDSPQIGSADNQCFRQDSLARLTSAWTPKTGVDCVTNPTTANLGGPAPYWLDWTFDSTGSRQSEKSHTATGDITRTYAVPAGGSNVIRPHAVTSMTTTTLGQNDVTINYQHDNSGNSICRPNTTVANTCPAGAGSQALTWNAEGRLETVAVSGTTTEANIYDADGTRLVRRDTNGTTVYLPGQEIRSEGTVYKGTRYYTFGGDTVANRNATTTSWHYHDHQGTQQITVDASTQAVSIRRQNPYGGPRGSQPAWPNTKGFVGGDNDATGLVNIGARQYDPVLGRFISVDPLLVADDPAQYNAYQYGANNPINRSDPTGTQVESGGASGHSCDAECDRKRRAAWAKTDADVARQDKERKERECQASFWCRTKNKVKAVVQAHVDAVVAGAKWVEAHAGDIGAVLGVVAYFLPPPANLIVGGIAMAASLYGAYRDFQKGNYVGAGMGVLGAIPGLGAVAKGVQAARAGHAAKAAMAARGAYVPSAGSRIARNQLNKAVKWAGRTKLGATTAAEAANRATAGFVAFDGAKVACKMVASWLGSSVCTS